jgi:hypothetical protein
MKIAPYSPPLSITLSIISLVVEIADNGYRMNAKHFVILLIAFLLSGCAFTSNTVMAGYRKMSAKNSVLGVILVKRNMQVAGPEETGREGLGGGDQTQAYYNLFGTEIGAVMKTHSRFRQVVFVSGADEMGLRQGDVALGATVALPHRSKFLSDTIHYLMIIDFLNIRRDQMTGGNMLGNEGITTGFSPGLDHLAYTASFALWDNAAGSIAAYGNISDKVAVAGPVTRDRWVETVRSIARAVTAGMPYGK